VHVAIIGLGTVGSGVAAVLTRHADRMLRRTGRPVLLRRAVVRDIARTRGVELPGGALTTDLNAVLNDREIGVAIHLVGGIHPAKEILLKLLESGKDVVTANKALLCECGDELFRRARELGRTIAFEAAVAGGIPIVATVAQALAANQITAISAILNGTSNYILSQMLREGWSYDAALSRAQELGYAEADPTLDIDGSDAGQKLAILVQLAFGLRVPVSRILRQGIDRLELTDLQYAEELGYTIKLLAVAKTVNDEVEMHVQPTLLRHGNPLATVHGSLNAVSVTGDVVGETWYSGAGAGSMPTASAVIADLIDTVTGRTRINFPRLELWDPASRYRLRPSEQTASRFYLRFNVHDRPHVLADIADRLGRQQISIASVMQHEAPENGENNDSTVPLVIMTHRTTTGRILAAEESLKPLDTLRPHWVRLPVAD
jgi:homoserine dehydrogenase